ncbi:MAG: CYTH domain-containing protein [Candidatus Aegiribacteria sp.]|nr:CYTH domain-containing protein [Candidatus Aegiribacteria sp.]
MLEMELKFRVDDFRDVERHLKSIGIEPGDPVRENNLVLDLMGGPLGKMDTLFRLRNCERGTLVTVKKPIPATALKVRHEQEAVLECSQEDALKLFGLLGYGVVYSYEKTRRECRIGKALICLDELWFGRFVEIEAESEEAVMKAVDALGFDPEEGIRFSYAALEKDAEQLR